MFDPWRICVKGHSFNSTKDLIKCDVNDVPQWKVINIGGHTPSRVHTLKGITGGHTPSRLHTLKDITGGHIPSRLHTERHSWRSYLSRLHTERYQWRSYPIPPTHTERYSWRAYPSHLHTLKYITGGHTPLTNTNLNISLEVIPLPPTQT